MSQMAGFKANDIYAHSTTSILLVMLAVYNACYEINVWNSIHVHIYQVRI
jgi:hypothetical protein